MAVASPSLTASATVVRPPRTSKISPIVLVRSSSMERKEQQQQRVVVCGGGVIGVCTAYFLAKKGAAVTLVEKSSVACAASGKAGGFLALDWCDGGPLSNLARTSFNLHRTLALQHDGPQAYGYRPLQTLSLSITEHQHQQPHPSGASRAAILPDWVDGPARNPKTIGTPATTAQVHPLLFTRTLLSWAVTNHGVDVVIGELERVEVEGGRARAVAVAIKEGDQRGGRIIEADAVVLALGPWSSRLPLLSSLFRVSGLKAHSIVLEPRGPETITPHALFLSYYPASARGGKPMDPEVYPRPSGIDSAVVTNQISLDFLSIFVIIYDHIAGNRLFFLGEVYVCGMSAEGEVPDDPEQVVGDPESIKVLRRVAGTVSSHLGEGKARVKAEQACFLPCTDDSRPVIGEISSVKRCYVATGHSCWGILNGPATGAAMAELVLDGRASIVDLSPFSPDRFLSKPLI
ncbi:hypothetical protein HHK36_002647 [Tetracentron sinense]|uniref:FAD dependent oxidoreductase domain-containing protein n=1 Tax=Tetracentron sinense TaxID=13715 RepID=A0A834ZR61_TETSI|nr:hypothetical protein HHK36_002647 [Tetracentron sinense]